MHFVDDVDLETRRCRAIAHTVDDFADIIDTGAAGGVHFQHVDMTIFGNGQAVRAHTARIRRRSPIAVGADAVQGTGDDARRRGFTDAPDAGQNIGLRQPIRVDGVSQGLHHGSLADQFGERGRTVLASKNLIGGGGFGGRGLVHRRSGAN